MALQLTQSSNTLKAFLLDMASQKSSFLIMDHSSVQKLIKNFPTTLLAALTNGEAERAVATIKKKEDDALLAYRSTPLQNGYSPLELLMCRKLKSLILITREQLMPTIPDTTSLRIRDKKIKERQKRNFDDHHGVRNSSQLKEFGFKVRKYLHKSTPK